MIWVGSRECDQLYQSSTAAHFSAHSTPSVVTVGWTGPLSPTPCGSSRQDSTPKEWIVRCALERLYGYHNEGQPLADNVPFMLRWLRRAPEDFLTGRVTDVGDVRLPRAGTESRLRWNLNQVYTALNEERRTCDLTWQQSAHELNCTPSRLTNLRTARLADMDLAMRITQWLGQPAAGFIYPAQW